MTVTGTQARQIIALYYEGDITKWLQSRFPRVKHFAIARIEQDTYHILVTRADATVIKEYLTEDLVPPFCRRMVHSAKPSHAAFEPGLDFHFDAAQQSSQSLRRTAAAYRSLSQRLPDARDRAFINGKLAELDAKMSKGK